MFIDRWKGNGEESSMPQRVEWRRLRSDDVVGKVVPRRLYRGLGGWESDGAI